MNHNIRHLQPSDVQTVVAFSLRAWRPIFESFHGVLGDAISKQLYPDWLASQAAAVHSVCVSDTKVVFVAEDVNRPVGFVALAFCDDPPSGEIDMMAVDPDFQRRGIGGALTAFALDHIAAAGVSLAVVATGGDSGHAPARATYERAGFVALPLVRYYKHLPHPG